VENGRRNRRGGLGERGGDGMRDRDGETEDVRRNVA
jgi:hypothetical protein